MGPSQYGLQVARLFCLWRTAPLQLQYASCGAIYSAKSRSISTVPTVSLTTRSQIIPFRAVSLSCQNRLYCWTTETAQACWPKRGRLTACFASVKCYACTFTFYIVSPMFPEPPFRRVADPSSAPVCLSVGGVTWRDEHGGRKLSFISANHSWIHAMHSRVDRRSGAERLHTSAGSTPGGAGEGLRRERTLVPAIVLSGHGRAYEYNSPPMMIYVLASPQRSKKVSRHQIINNIYLYSSE